MSFRFGFWSLHSPGAQTTTKRVCDVALSECSIEKCRVIVKAGEVNLAESDHLPLRRVSLDSTCPLCVASRSVSYPRLLSRVSYPWPILPWRGTKNVLIWTTGPNYANEVERRVSERGEKAARRRSTKTKKTKLFLVEPSPRHRPARGRWPRLLSSRLASPLSHSVVPLDASCFVAVRNCRSRSKGETAQVAENDRLRKLIGALRYPVSSPGVKQDSVKRADILSIV